MTEKNKDGWTRVPFGDVVQQIRDRVDPRGVGLKRYVAGEHMDTNDLRICRWGLIGDGYLGPAFHMRFKQGHVLYGSRRTYLRKVAVADFEGITASTTFVLGTKDPKILLQEYLPLIMQTESFHTHSIKQSKGSVNPYINFSDLTWYEFVLPPLEEQRRIVEVLSMADSVVSSIMVSLDALDSLRTSLVVEQLDKSQAPTMRLGDIATFERGCSYKSTDYVKEGVGRPFLNLKSVTRDARFSQTGVKWVRNDFEPSCKIKIGDLFFANTDLTPGLLLVGAPFFFPGIETMSDPCFSMDLTRVTPRGEAVETLYLYYLLTLPRVRARMRVLTRGSTVGHLQLSAVPDIEVPVLPAEEQIVFLERMNGIQESRQIVVNRIADAQALRSEILQSIVGEVANV